MTAGETRDLQTAVPKAIHTTLWRLVLFFIGSITVMCALIPWRKAGVGESPFVLVFNGIGIPYAGHHELRVVLTAVLSASNSGLYASTRMVWSMGNEGMIPRWFAKTNRRGVPILALCAAMAGSLLALLSSVIAASTVYLVLVALSGLVRRGGVDRHRLPPDHVPSPLAGVRPFHQRTQIPHARLSVRILAAFILCTASFVLVIFDVEQRFALVAELVFIVACYGGVFPATVGTQAQKATEADDLDTLWVARDWNT